MKLKLIVTFLLLTVLGFAQNKGTITGILTDKDLNNEPLPFANVNIKGTTTGVSTDEKGKYTITAEAGTYTIQFSFLGYETIEEKNRCHLKIFKNKFSKLLNYWLLAVVM